MLTKPEEPKVLMNFYKRVRPWGLWGPVLDMVRRDEPSFQPNKDFRRDMFNVVVGVCWQTCLTALPIYIVIRKTGSALVALGLLALTSLVLKFTWYDRLERA